MWKVGGLKIVTAASRRIILPGWHRNWWKSAFFYKTLRTRKFSTGKFFEGSTHGILTHSRFRICVLKGSATHFCPCYSCPKSGEGGKTRLARKKIKRCHKKIRRPQFTFFGLHTESAWSQPTWRLKIENCVLFFYVNVRWDGNKDINALLVLIFFETRINFSRP